MVKQAIKKNPWNIKYTKDNYQDSYKIMKDCILLRANTYQNPNMKLKNGIASLFLRHGSSLSLTAKIIRNEKKFGLIQVELNLNRLQISW